MRPSARPSRHLVARLVLAAALFTIAACEDSGYGTDGDNSVSVGDIVITEIMANPEGSDTGQEWVEVYNAADRAIDLRGMKLVRRSGKTQKGAIIQAESPVMLEPGQYGVLASGPLGIGEIHVYAGSFGDLPNTGSFVRFLRPDNTELDSVCYGNACDPAGPSAASGVSYAFGGGTPDYQANDDPGLWCNQEPTPGEANASCGSPVPPPEGCEGAVAPEAGRVRITEVFANPAGADGGKEWFEFQVTEGACVDLSGVRVNANLESGASGGFTFAPAGGQVFFQPGYYVVAGAEAALDGATASHTLKLTLGNSESNAFLALWSGSELIDGVAYGVPADSKSQQRDDTGQWCVAPEPSMDGTFSGSPGRANPLCPRPPEPECEGAVSPEPGRIVITEVFANPAGTDTNKEWFEFQVTEGPCVDMTGVRVNASLESGSSGGFTIAHTGGQTHFEPGYYVVAGSEAALDGVVAAHVLKLTLGNSESNAVVALWSDGVLIDGVRYGVPAENKSQQRDADGMWCVSPEQSSDGRFHGTPGRANPLCERPPAPDCEGAVAPTPGRVVVTEVFANPAGTDSGKEWFEIRVTEGPCVDLTGVRITANRDAPSSGFVVAHAGGRTHFDPGYYVFAGDEAALDGATAAHALKLTLGNSDSNATLALWAGNERIDGVHYGVPAEAKSRQLDADGEWCHSPAQSADGTFYGTPGQANPACGGGMVEPGGDCEGNDPPAYCACAAPAGRVRITEIMADPGTGRNPDGEWFEIQVTGADCVNLNGVRVTTNLAASASGFTLGPAGGDMAFAPGYHVIARPAATLCGAASAYPLTLTLPNTGNNTSLALWSGDELLDGVDYPNTTGGRSWQRDDTGTWCRSALPAADVAMCGGTTPGQPNPDCE